MRVPRTIAAITALLLISLPAWATSQLRQIGMVNVPGSPGFGELAFAKGMLVMTHPAASAVDVFDPSRRRVVAQITGLQSPRGIAVDEQNGRIYVADAGSNSIAVISTDTWKSLTASRCKGLRINCCSTMVAKCIGATPREARFRCSI